MVWIKRHDYETVTAQCDNCGFLCIFNRIDDIGDPGPYMGRDVTCSNCREQFRIIGDIINPAYELFIFDAGEHFQSKRYMICAASLAQAWEIFFTTFIFSNYLYRPFFENEDTKRDLEQLNRLSSQLEDAIRNHTFFPLRNVLMNTVVRRVHPQTLDESRKAIPRIVKENFGQDVPMAQITAFPDPKARDLLLRLLNLTIGDLRNKVVHRRAYRPRRAEVKKCYDEELDLLNNVKRAFDVRTFEDWRARSEEF
jgi:hypothetical protein